MKLLGGGCSLLLMDQDATRAKGRGAWDSKEVGTQQGQGEGEQEKGLPKTLREETYPIGAFW